MRVYALEPAQGKKEFVKQAKFVTFTWTGPSATMMTKAAANPLKSLTAGLWKVRVLQRGVWPVLARPPPAPRLTSPPTPTPTHTPQGSHADFQFDSGNPMSEADIEARLMSSHKPVGGYQFGSGGGPDELEDDELEAAAAEKAAAEAVIAEAAAAAAAKEAAAAAEIEAARKAEEDRLKKLSILPTRLTSRKTVQKVHNPIIDGYDFSDLTNKFVLECLSDVDDPLAWVLCSVPEDAPKKIALTHSGQGGLDEILPLLSDSDVQFGAFKVTAVDRKGTKVALRARIVFFSWTGPLTPSKARFRNTGVIKPMTTYLAGLSIEMQLNGDTAELNTDVVCNRLQRVCPASEYKFGFFSKEAQADEYSEQMDAAKAELKSSQAGAAAEKEAEFVAKAAAKAAAERAALAEREQAELARAAKLAAAEKVEAEAKKGLLQRQASASQVAADLIKSSRAKVGEEAASPAKPAALPVVEEAAPEAAAE